MTERVMKTLVTAGVVGWMAAVSVASAGAQPSPDPSRGTADRRQRYQMRVMEQVLERAVEHGATLTRERLRPYLPADMLLTENARVRGFRLEGYGMFFDVAVPSLEGTLPWMFRVLDQNNLGLDSALRTLRSFIESASPGDENVQQAFKRLELQVGPAMPMTIVGDPQSPAFLTGASTPGPVAPDPPTPSSPPRAMGLPPLGDPQEIYRADIRDTLMDAMLDHGRALGIGPEEWFTIAARSNDDRPPVLPAETESRTVVIKVKGSDLNAFLGGQISRDEARGRMDVRVF
jgi:hypothetical protein